MKKAAGWLLTIVLLFGIVYYFVVNGYFARFFPTDNVVTPVTQASLFLERAGVLLKAPGAADYSEVTAKETTINTGTYLKTNTTGKAFVAFPDNSIVSLEPNTELQLNVSASGINIFQVAGKTIHRVQSVMQGKNYNVETSNVNAAVRGTVFVFEVLPNQDVDVYVVESTVDVERFGMQDGKKIVQSSKPVENGNMAKVSSKLTKGNSIAVTKLPEDFTKSNNLDENMQQMNNLFDKILQGELDKLVLIQEGSATCANYDRTTLKSLLAKLDTTDIIVDGKTLDTATAKRVITTISDACANGNISKAELESVKLLAK